MHRVIVAVEVPNMRTDAQCTSWGIRIQDWASLIEPLFLPLYEAVLDRLDAAVFRSLIDIGCGSGLAAEIAAVRGFGVSGIDAAVESIEFARQRLPHADLRVGMMESLPFETDTFDVATMFNTLQYAAEPSVALREAIRVTKPGGRIAIGIWSAMELCDQRHPMLALSGLAGSQEPVPFRLSAEGRLEDLLRDADLALISSGTVECPFRFHDLGEALRALFSSGNTIEISARVGVEVVSETLASAIRHFERSDGSYLLNNRFRYLVAAPL